MYCSCNVEKGHDKLRNVGSQDLEQGDASDTYLAITPSQQY